MIENVAQYRRILAEFPNYVKFCFAYGSGAFKQKSDPSRNMLDLVFVVENSNLWHAENLKKNPQHYAFPMRTLGHGVISKLQQSCGANIYYNTLIRTSEGRLVKYGVISETSLIEDLLDWNVLYAAGRLHKPVTILTLPDEDSQLRTALVQNLHSAVHTALLLLPENFSELDFYKCIARLSYNGDFRMYFGEDKNKVSNIVEPQLAEFRKLYSSILRHYDKYMDVPMPEQSCHQDTSPSARIHHLNLLPRVPQAKIVNAWTRNLKSKDAEDCLRAIAHDPECSELVDRCLRSIVWNSSVSQSLKGILTAGFYKSFKYSGAKIVKMVKSEERKMIEAGQAGPDSEKVQNVVNNVVKKQTQVKETSK